MNVFFAHSCLTKLQRFSEDEKKQGRTVAKITSTDHRPICQTFC